MPGENKGRAHCAEAFQKHLFPSCKLTLDEYNMIVDRYVPAGFSARNPGNHDRVNTPGAGELAIPLEHFEVGFRLPLWPEVRLALRYYGVVPAQLNPNSVAILIAFICYMRSERIEFSLPIFRKLFNFRAKGGQQLEVTGLANKHHHWGEKFVYVSGDFGNVPLQPVQYEDAAYKPPALGSRESAILEFFGTKEFDVPYLRRDVDSLPLVHSGEGTVSPQIPFFIKDFLALKSNFAGEREVPLRQPFAEGRGVEGLAARGSLALAEASASACREDPAPSMPPPAKKRKVPLPSLRTLETPKPSALEKGKAPAVPPVQPPPEGRSFEAILQMASEMDAAAKSRAEASARNISAASEAGGEVVAAETSASVPPPEVPRGHQNFGFGVRYADSEGKPQMEWDPESNSIRVSTLLPRWAEGENVTGEAFSLGYGLYSREDAGVFDQMSTRLLAFDATRALLRAFELTHMCARRSITLDKNFTDMCKAREDAMARAHAAGEELAKAQQELADARLALSLRPAAEDSAQVRELRAELANARCESVLLREQLRAELTKVPPPELDARLRSRYLSEYDVDKLLQANAQATVKLTLETLRDVKLLREDGATIDARQLLPWLYDPVPKPPGAPDSPLSDAPRSSTAVGETSEEGSGDDSSESTSGDYSASPGN
ncbi:hypothetical protein KSP39_PZI005333 [Platanthera zijinensis]|uniref:Transposase (putative) gypsy type domain-containing protein n=1 Tax=Platanthera zijinensis TaxID=2320716 RepID=A0AAP0GBG7_9ASPA